MKFIEELRNLNLPVSQYAVFGSGPLAIRGLRENNDIDIVVSPDLFHKLSKEYPNRGHGLALSQNVDAFVNWDFVSMKPEDILSHSEIIDGISFAKMELVLELKKRMNRDKDISDIKLIEEYIINQNSKN